MVLTTLLTLVMYYLSNALPLFGHSNGEVSNPLPNACTTAGLTFAIWSVIFLGLLVFVVYYWGVYLARPEMTAVLGSLIVGVLITLAAAFVRSGKPSNGVRRLTA